jgi:opacity protein-like surface antigen
VGEAASAIAFGVDTQYMQDGSLYSEYRLRDAESGKDIQAAVGLRNGWLLSDGLRLVTNAERLTASNGNATALAAGLEYTGSELWKSSGRVEWRQDTDNTNHLVTLGVARKLDRDWTLLARDYFNQVSPRTAAGGDSRQNRFQLGFAYRPADSNRFDALGLVEQRNEYTAGAEAIDRDVRIVSLRVNYHPSRPWWVSGRFAHKRVNELLLGSVRDDYSASLVGTRVTYDITNRWTVGGLFNVLQGSGGARQYAYGLEVGYVMVDNLWVTLGYNWRGFSDRDLSGSEYTNRGWVLGLRYKFDEDLFRGKNTSVNKTLTPAATTP